MNRLFIIGNLVRDPELRTTQDGKSVCNFTVAVNRRKQDETDFFRASVWGAMAENCQKYLAKGRKVAVTGTVSVRTYAGNDGATRAQMEVLANDVEFLSPKSEADQKGDQMNHQAEQAFSGFTPVNEELPF